MTSELSNIRNAQFDDLSEREVVEKAKLDSAAISFLYRQHYESIYRYVNRRIGNEHDTNDIVAEVFMSMVRYLPRFRWTGAPFRSWLFAITTNQINRWIRKKRFSSLWRSLSSAEPIAVESNEGKDESMEQIRNALLSLPLAYQTALTLHYFEDLSVEAISEIMGSRPGTVKSQLSRGRELLRAKFTESE